MGSSCVKFLQNFVSHLEHDIFLFPIHTEIKLFRIKFMRFKRNFGWPKHARVRLGGRVGWVGVDWWSTKHLTQRIMAWPAFLCPLREEKREIGQSTRYPARRIPIAWMLHARWCCDGMGLQKEKYSHDKRAWPICIDALAVCRPTHPTSILHSCAACVASCLCARISRWRVAVWPIYHFYRSSDHVHISLMTDLSIHIMIWELLMACSSSYFRVPRQMGSDRASEKYYVAIAVWSQISDWSFRGPI